MKFKKPGDIIFIIMIIIIIVVVIIIIIIITIIVIIIIPYLVVYFVISAIANSLWTKTIYLIVYNNYDTLDLDFNWNILLTEC